MIRKFPIILFVLFLGASACQSISSNSYPDVQVAGAMQNVMWKGELAGVIRLDSVDSREGLYGLGPESYLTGELLINNGKSFVSRVLTDSTMRVEETYEVAAPFLVYGYVHSWQETPFPGFVNDIPSLEQFLDSITTDKKRPFVFKLTGTISDAQIHIQNLPEGTQVRSPEEAHQGQTLYLLEDEAVEIIGFFSTEHQGTFTHHDSFSHMHLITQDELKMGHLDWVIFEPTKLKLYLPVK